MDCPAGAADRAGRRGRSVAASITALPVLGGRSSALPDSAVDAERHNGSKLQRVLLRPVRTTDTRLQIAELPVLADRVTAALKRKGVSAAEVAATTVGSIGNTDLLRFTAHAGRFAERCADRDTVRAAVHHLPPATRDEFGPHAVEGLQQRITSLQAEGTTRARVLAGQLQSKLDDLQTLQTLQTSDAVLVRPAIGAIKIRPTPRSMRYWESPSASYLASDSHFSETRSTHVSARESTSPRSSNCRFFPVYRHRREVLSASSNL